MAIASLASRRYAEALVEASVAEDTDRLGEVRRELAGFAQTVREAPDLKNALLNPVFTSNERSQVLDQTMARLNLSKTVQNFLKLVAEKGRMPELDDIHEAFSDLADARQGKVRATVTSAAELQDTAVDQLKRALERKTGKTIDLSREIDPALIGGVRVQIGSLVFDGTIQRQLENLQETLRNPD